MSNDPYADLRADIEAERAYRKRRSNQATEAHHKWLDRQPAEVQAARLAKLRTLMTREELSTHKQQYRRKTKARLVAMFGDKCHDCGGTFPHVCYDFHHTDPTKKTNIVAVMYQHKWETVVKEVADCVMICAN